MYLRKGKKSYGHDAGVVWRWRERKDQEAVKGTTVLEKEEQVDALHGERDNPCSPWRMHTVADFPHGHMLEERKKVWRKKWWTQTVMD